MADDGLLCLPEIFKRVQRLLPVRGWRLTLPWYLTCVGWPGAPIRLSPTVVGRLVVYVCPAQVVFKHSNNNPHEHGHVIMQGQRRSSLGGAARSEGAYMSAAPGTNNRPQDPRHPPPPGLAACTHPIRIPGQGGTNATWTENVHAHLRTRIALFRHPHAEARTTAGAICKLHPNGRLTRVTSPSSDRPQVHVGGIAGL
eukprot:360737-Chlamydomonas_euryale.AAC.7